MVTVQSKAEQEPENLRSMSFSSGNWVSASFTCGRSDEGSGLTGMSTADKKTGGYT